MSYVVVEKEDHSVNVAGPNPASGNTGGLGIYNGEMRVSSLEGRTTDLESSTKSIAERVAAGEMNGMAGLDNGGTPPLPGVVLSAQIAAAIAAGWPENRIFWVSLGTESGSGNGDLGNLSLSATSTLFLGTLAGYSSGNLGPLAFTGSSTLALGALAGVIVSAGSANLGNLSLTGTSTLSLGTLAGVQIGNTGNLALTGTSTLALGSLVGIAGVVNGNLGSLSLTGTSTLALGTLAGVANITQLFFEDFIGANGSDINRTKLPTEYKFGTGIDTTLSKTWIQNNCMQFVLKHTSGTALIGINEVVPTVLDFSGTNKYRITYGLYPGNAGELVGCSVIPATNVGAFNTAGDTVNVPNVIVFYSDSAGYVVFRRRTAGVNAYSNTYGDGEINPATAHEVVVEISATSLKFSVDGTVYQNTTETVPLTADSRLVLWGATNGSISNGWPSCDVAIIERIN